MHTTIVETTVSVPILIELSTTDVVDKESLQKEANDIAKAVQDDIKGLEVVVPIDYLMLLLKKHATKDSYTDKDIT